VHCHTPEGLLTGLRNFLRPPRGMNKIYFNNNINIFDFSYNLKAVTDAFLRTLLGAPAAASG
jgi:hypothetical protein